MVLFNKGEKMKIISMYLPQFHRVKENDEWWGEGFTEWTAVKNAQKYYPTQKQPKEPLNGYYYDLMDKNTMKWQAELMHRYGIYGVAFYHYWFKDGRRILERPAENLLNWKDVEIPFCFSWANETWARSWSNISEKNAWSTIIDSSLCEKDDKGILLEQEYGGKKEWKEHFDYLKMFFEDDRYIKINGRPVIIIYKPLSIPCLPQMISYWRTLSAQEEFQDIFVIGNNAEIDGYIDATLLQEPQNTLRSYRSDRIVEYERICEQILRQPIRRENQLFYCGFPGYDDSPRRGEGGTFISGATPQKFENFMTKLIAKGKYCLNEFTFINAWNEWGEGMYLEPDTENEYGMLEAISNAIIRSEKELWNDNSTMQEEIGYLSSLNRYESYWRIMDKWLLILEKKIDITNYFIIHGYSNIALYGIGMLCGHLINQLDTSAVCIDYGIDQRGNDVQRPFRIYKPEDNWPFTQAIIVTATFDYANISTLISKKIDVPIVSLGEIIQELLENNN